MTSGCSVSDSRVSIRPRELTGFGPWLGKGDVQSPLLPANVLVCLAEEVRLSPLLLEELHHELPASSLLVCAVYRSHQGHRSLVDQRFQVHIIDGREGEVEQVAGERRDGGEVAMEEDGVQDCCKRRQLWPSDMYVFGPCRTEGKRSGDHAEASANKQRIWRRAARHANSPFTTSFTHARSAKISRLYSGRRRCSMLASAEWLLVPRRAAFPRCPGATGRGACWSSTVKFAPAKRSVCLCLCEGGRSEECDCWGGGVVLKTIDRAALRQPPWAAYRPSPIPFLSGLTALHGLSQPLCGHDVCKHVRQLMLSPAQRNNITAPPFCSQPKPEGCMLPLTTGP